MSYLKPTYYFDKVWDISIEFLRESNIKCVLLDVDNTLTTHDNPEINTYANEWLDRIKNAGIIPIILSNNIDERVSPFAKSIGVDFICHAQKPKAKGIKKAIELTGVPKSEMAIVGDQIFTDVLCGNNAKIKSILVTPLQLEDMPFFKVKRFFENIILRNERKQ